MATILGDDSVYTHLHGKTRNDMDDELVEFMALELGYPESRAKLALQSIAKDYVDEKFE